VLESEQQSGNPPGPAYRIVSCQFINTRARGGNRSPSMSRRQRLLAEQALPSTEPRARYLTSPAAAYGAAVATVSIARSIDNTVMHPNGQAGAESAGGSA
jgi:hypothetical protein